MYISQFQVSNYKSYHKPEKLRFKPGFNVLLGQNDAGKTALLEAVSLAFAFNPHRSLKSLPNLGSQVHPTSQVDFWVSITNSELKDLMSKFGFVATLLLPELGTEFCRNLGYSGDDPSSLQKLVDWFDEREVLEFALRSNGSALLPGVLPSFGLYLARQSTQAAQARLAVQVILDENKQLRAGAIHQGGETDIGHKVAFEVQKRIYRFSAQRVILGTTKIDTSSALSPDAGNLAQVLHVLQGSNPQRYRRLCSYARQIFPHIQEISLSLSGTDNVGIRVWNTDPIHERPDLAISLSECGTGVGQVLAILYVVVNSDFPQVIIVDEPQSFLHPAAVRKLMEILRGFRQHQFIVSTHSPAVIAATNPETITVVRLQDGESVLEPVDTENTKSLQISLAEVGASTYLI